MDILHINYRFEFGDGMAREYPLEIDTRTMLVRNVHNADPGWTDLDYKICKHCPLDPEQSAKCPAAVTLAGVTDAFENFASYNEVLLEVSIDKRTVKQHTSIQSALSSFYGLLLATSGCPYTDYMKPMARFHIPLADTQETLFRAAGMYLLSQYFRNKDNNSAELDLDGLTEIYDNLTKVNQGIVNRMRCALHSDSSMNAIVVLDMKAKYVPMVIESQLDSLKTLFETYFH